jgi:hypothetical protein
MSILTPVVGDTAPATAEAGTINTYEIVAATTASPATAPAAALPMWVSTQGLPEVFVWVEQQSGLVGCTFRPMVSLAITGIANAGEWIALTGPQAIPLAAPAVPIYFRDRIPGVAAVGIEIVTPAGAVNSVFRVVLGAGG